MRPKTKGSSLQPTSGKISVEISPGKGDDMPEEPGGTVANTDAADLDQVSRKRSSVKASKSDEKLGSKKNLGRERRR